MAYRKNSYHTVYKNDESPSKNRGGNSPRATNTAFGSPGNRHKSARRFKKLHEN
jgi:hypothetical protein